MAASATAVATLATALRDRILNGELAPGTRLVERELVESYDVARVTVRSALQQLAADGLVVIESHRGARVAALDTDELHDLFALRAALEVEAARIALAERPQDLDTELGNAIAELTRVCGAKRVRWRRVVDAHEEVHRALVDAAHSPRISAVHRSLAVELRLFVVALRPVWSPAAMVAHHVKLRRELQTNGPEAVRRHLSEGEHSIAGTGRASP